MREPGTTGALTDFELAALLHRHNLADGHAYHELRSMHPGIPSELQSLWEECERTPVPEAEASFLDAAAHLARSSGMRAQGHARITPTASNSIDIVAAVLAERRATTFLVEPTFDNLSLILRRRSVPLVALDEWSLSQALAADAIGDMVDPRRCDALFLVNPNNPTGSRIDEVGFRRIAEHCAEHGIVLVLDCSFRFYDREGYDDHAILLDTGCSYLVIEDTGKVWPTHDLKASLLFASPDLAAITDVIYNELYLCHSRFALALLERCLRETADLGLARALWSEVELRRTHALAALEGTSLVIDDAAKGSTLPVLWLDCRQSGLSDLELTARLADLGVMLLPGRHFFWASACDPSHHHNVRLALMKPMEHLRDALVLLHSYLKALHPTAVEST